MYTVSQITTIPIEEIIRYVRQHYPPDYHFYANEFQLRYLAVTFLDREGLLNPHDSQILRQPYIGQVYVAEGGNTLATTEHFFMNLIPGFTYLPYVTQI